MTMQTKEHELAIEQEGEKDRLAIPAEVPILPLRQTVVYPLTFLPLSIDRPESIKLIDDVVLGNKIVGLVTVKNAEADRATPEDLYSIGTAAVVHRAVKTPTGSVGVIVQGLERIKPTEFIQTEPYLKAKIEVIPDEEEEESLEVEALSRNTIDLFQRLVSLVSYLPNELMVAVLNTEAPGQLAYVVANAVRMDSESAQQILEIAPVKDRLHKLNAFLARELEVLELGQKIKDEAQSDMEKTQREYYLRQQLKAIQKELGEEDEQAKEVNELREKIETAGMSEEAKKEALRELDRLSSMPQAAAEYSVIRTYLDWLTELPWQVSTDDNLDINRAREILDEDHYDLEEIKERILEYLAVRKLRLERKGEEDLKESRGAILNFVGPPGTGKTSLGRSIARALGREFIRMSLGGMRDEAEIRGHRRTYIGALPGRIIQSIKRVGSNNPVFMLDEVDKIGTDYRGDPSSALLEVLDPEQNYSFRDHYLDVDWDLSPVMFITTANILHTIPAPLLDRMETLDLDGYTEEEKVKIAQRYLIPRHGEEGKVVATKDNISEFLGQPKFYNEAAERTEVPGVATGLVVTTSGGDITFIEATKMKGSKGLTLTGKLGDVMKESAQAALSYVRSRAKELNIDEGFFDETDLHLHFPAGAIPKDGPSAGVTIATALVSLLTDTPVKCDVGMTGEITLRGKVLPIGGVKQKMLAAARVGLETVILPRRNENDLDELPEEVRNSLNFVLVDTMDEVLEAALGDGSLREKCE
jgi:ATP-dependent Lon protease